MQKESKIEVGRLMSEHVHILIFIPPKHEVGRVVGSIKGKSSIHIARVFQGRKQNFAGQSVWGRGYFVSRERQHAMRPCIPAWSGIHNCD